MYNYSIFAANAVGEGPPFDGSFLTREDSELISKLRVCKLYHNSHHQYSKQISIPPRIYTQYIQFYLGYVVILHVRNYVEL